MIMTEALKVLVNGYFLATFEDSNYFKETHDSLVLNTFRNL